MKRSLASLATFQNGFPFKPEDLGDVGTPVIRIRQLVDQTSELDRHLGELPSRFRISNGDLIFSWSGSLAVRTWDRGPAYLNQHLFRVEPVPEVAQGWLAWALQASLPHLAGLMHGSAMTHITQPMLKLVTWELPDLDSQRRVADFLDDRVDRIDRIIAARRQQLSSMTELVLRASFEVISGSNIDGERRASGLPWLGSVPATWPVLPVATEFSVDLGKMLDEKRQTGTASIPYLRNTNVQWDAIDTADLKTMDIADAERARYTVELGDLLVCEGGQPGRAAIWDGSATPIGFQKALHRVRSRGRSSVAWLLECLRTAVALNVFTVDGGQTTIAHLTNEQLRGTRFPFPDPEVQARLTRELASERMAQRQIQMTIERSIDLLAEYKTSLITAAVTGELDVTTASRRIPGA